MIKKELGSLYPGDARQVYKKYPHAGAREPETEGFRPGTEFAWVKWFIDLKCSGVCFPGIC